MNQREAKKNIVSISFNFLAGISQVDNSKTGLALDPKI